MYSVKIWAYTPNGGKALVYDETYDEVEHYDGDIWLAKRDDRELFIRPAKDQLLVVEELQK